MCERRGHETARVEVSPSGRCERRLRENPSEDLAIGADLPGGAGRGSDRGKRITHRPHAATRRFSRPRVIDSEATAEPSASAEKVGAFHDPYKINRVAAAIAREIGRASCRERVCQYV